MKIKLKIDLYVSFGYVAGSSLMKIVYRSKKDFCNGQPLHKEVRILKYSCIFCDSNMSQSISCAKVLIIFFERNPVLIE